MNFITAKASAKSSAKDSKTSMKKTQQSTSIIKNTKTTLAANSVSEKMQLNTNTTTQSFSNSTTHHDEFHLDVLNVKSMLITQKKDILNKSHEFRAAQTERPQVTEEAEAASLDVNHSLSIHLHERDRSSLYMIEKALSKISEGTYGICESCAAQISARRLSARPFTPICIDCAEEQEARLN